MKQYNYFIKTKKGIWNYGICRPKFKILCNANLKFKKHYTYRG